MKLGDFLGKAGSCQAMSKEQLIICLTNLDLSFKHDYYLMNHNLGMYVYTVYKYIYIYLNIHEPPANQTSSLRPGACIVSDFLQGLGIEMPPPDRVSR